MNTIVINFEVCKGCYLCIEACPKDLIEVCETPNAAGAYPVRLKADAACTACAACATMCPDAAIEVFRAEKVPAKE